jgi:hypothetical protein
MYSTYLNGGGPAVSTNAALAAILLPLFCNPAAEALPQAVELRYGPAGMPSWLPRHLLPCQLNM